TMSRCGTRILAHGPADYQRRRRECERAEAAERDAVPVPCLPRESRDVAADRARAVVDAEVDRARRAAVDRTRGADAELRRGAAREVPERDAAESDDQG